jgi:peptidoglycan/xylan/chitin deacetylase (PgdA/CDA1 family)
VLDMLDRHGARATFFVIGEKATRHAALLREVRRRGHTIGNHTHRHPSTFAALGLLRQRRELAAAQAAIADACGAWPRWFRAPAGLRNPLLDPVLALERLSLVTWTRRGYDAVARDPTRVLARLTRGLGESDILLLHDTPGADPAQPVVLHVLPRLLERLEAAGLRSVALPDAHAPAAVG